MVEEVSTGGFEAAKIVKLKDKFGSYGIEEIDTVCIHDGGANEERVGALGVAHRSKVSPWSR